LPVNYTHMISSKLPNTGTSIFAVMSKLANEQKAINLSQGFPDFEISQELKDLVNKYIQQGYNQYAPMPGVFSLREQIAAKVQKLYGAKYDPETEITVTAGATQAIYTAITAFVKEDDEVIVFEPAYDSYVPAIRLSGARPVFLKLNYPNYSINWDDVSKSINSRTRMIIINTPHNPSGSVLSEEDMIRLQKITSGSKIIIVSDEVYEHILFDGLIHHSASRFPELAERTIVVSSFGKIFQTTGWKVGYATAPQKLMNEFRKVHQMIVFAVNHPVQLAYAEFLQKEDEYLRWNHFYQQKRDIFASHMKDSRFKLLPCQGTYFQLIDFSSISDEKDTDFANLLTIQHKVATIPVSVFYHEHTDKKVLRVCIAKKDETLIEAARILSTL
jgi:methionine transaminase